MSITNVTTLETQLKHWLHESTAMLKVMTADRDKLAAENKTLRDAPPAQQPLTVAEVEQIREQWSYDIHGDRTRYIVRMTEQAHGIKGASL